MRVVAGKEKVGGAGETRIRRQQGGGRGVVGIIPQILHKQPEQGEANLFPNLSNCWVAKIISV